jgi:hypothetical protein
MSREEETLEIKKIIANNYPHKEMIHQCDALWSYLIKLKAHFKSQLSGNIVGLQSHHIFKKPNLLLRYEIVNGLCVTSNEHTMIHSNMKLWEPKIRSIIGKTQWERLEALKYGYTKITMVEIRNTLIEQIKFYEGK